MNTIERSIPKQLKGIEKHYEATRKFITMADAQLCYDHAIGRLLNINKWHELSMLQPGAVQLMSEKGKPYRRKAKTGDFVRIGVPGPGNEDGSGYDWVQVTNLLFSGGVRKEQCLITLQPCPMPGGDKVAHFFTGDSSTNFLITRNGRVVQATYYGRNELPNTAASGLKEQIRNVAVATGAMLGFSNLMWKPMVHALIMDGTQLRDRQPED